MVRKQGKNGRLHSYFRIGRRILVFILLVVLTTILLLPLHKIAHSRMAELRDRLISQAEHILGRRIVYSSIGPSIFGTLDIRNIRIYGDDSLPVMTIAKVRISYSLLALIQGKIIESFRAIQIDRPVITLDQTRDADLLKLFSPRSKRKEESSNVTVFLPENVLFWVRNGEVSVTDETNHFKIEGLTFDAFQRQERLRFQGKGNCGLALQDKPVDLRLSFKLSGEWSPDFQSGNLILNLAFSSKDLVNLQPITVNLAMEDNKIALKKINDQAAFDFSLDYDITANHTTGMFRCENFSPKDSLTLAGPWEDFNQWLGLSASGTVSFEHDPEQGISYTLALSGNVPTNLPIGDASFVINGAGDQKYIDFHNLSVQVAQGTLSYQGAIGFDPILPEGFVSISNFSLSGKDTINARLRIHSQDNEIRFEGKTLYFGSLLLPELQGSLLREDKSLSFDISLMRAEESSEEVKPSGIKLEGVCNYEESPYLEMSLALHSFAIPDLMDMIRPFKDLPNVSKFGSIPVFNPLNQVAVHTDIYIATDFKRFYYNIPQFMITYEENEELFFGAISGTDRRFQLHEGRIQWDEAVVQASAQADFTNLQDISFSLGAAYLDKPYYFEGVILDQHSISIHGLHGFQVYINKAESGGYSGYIEVKNLPIPYRGQTARFSIESSLRYDSPELWSFDLKRLELADVLTPLSVNSTGTVLVFSGRADPQGAEFQEVFFDDGRGALQGTLSLSWNRNFSDLSGTIRLNNDAGNEWYAIEAQVKDKRLALNLEGSDMQLGRFIPNAFNAVASGDVDLVWNNQDSFYANLNRFSLAARVSDKDLHITGDASLNTESFNIEGLHLRYGEIQLDMPNLVLDRLESRGKTEARFQMIARNRDMDVSFTTEVDFKPIDSWFNLQEAANSFEGHITVPAARFNAIHIEEPFDLTVSRTNTLISFSGGPRDMIRLQFIETGDFYAGLSYPSPIRGTIIGNIGVANKTIDAQSQDLYVDLPGLWRFIPSEVKEIINITGGFVTASVEVSGPLGDPEFFGTAEGNSVRLKVPQFLTQEIRPVPMTVLLDGNMMSFGQVVEKESRNVLLFAQGVAQTQKENENKLSSSPLPAAVGAGQGTIAGLFRFDRWIPDVFSLDITVPQKSAIPFGFDIMGVIAHGKASGNLNLSMKDKTLTVSGDLTGDNTEITLNTDELAMAGQLQESEEDSAVPVIVNIVIRSGRKVEFLWPNAQWPILQTSASMGSSVRIHNDSISRRYSFIGDVNLRSGEIFYFERSFYIREGVLSFNENENRFEPRFSVRAEVRDQINSGPLTISMIVDNAPLQSFTPRFESSPPLSQMEILSLLGQNLTGISRDGESTTGQIPIISSTTDILAQTQVYRRFQRGIRDILALDMLSFRTQVGQNILLQSFQNARQTTDKTADKTADDTVDKTGIGNYFDNTTVFIGKYLTPTMFLQGMLSLRYGEKRTVFKGLTVGGYTFEPDLGIELRGPMFDIQVHLAFLHLESLFLKDVSFTLTRRRSTFRDMFLNFP